ncbi:hypothetical protein NW762_012901 [Fusarium torreyae]|uniref:Uncharacterized protein n=1 Tax=Fusarium torreyae TaxID=1237075 RepID=A0A9W8RLQ2_9HYPO|nr:hypothetical protein NW762_012901 [Fusarium torreyae]
MANEWFDSGEDSAKGVGKKRKCSFPEELSCSLEATKKAKTAHTAVHFPTPISTPNDSVVAPPLGRPLPLKRIYLDLLSYRRTVTSVVEWLDELPFVFNDVDDRRRDA